MLPVIGILLSLVLGGRYAERIVLVLLIAGLGVAAAVFVGLARRSFAGLHRGRMAAAARHCAACRRHFRGDDGDNRGCDVRHGAVCPRRVRTAAGSPETRAPLVFWILLLAIWSALNAVVLGDDLFNLYVALELLTFAAVPLVCLKGDPETIKAALRYMLFALLGSVLYLLGTVLIYGAYGTLDIALLSSRVQPEPVAWIAAALMTMGLLAKTALFPLHLWLPPAHAGAPAPGSAVLSALVVKGSFFLIVRLWFDAMPGLMDLAAAQMLGNARLRRNSLRQRSCAAPTAFKALDRLFDHRADRLPVLHFSAGARRRDNDPWSGFAWTGGWLQLFSHAFAKAAMFMAAGLIAETLGHDRIAQFGGIGRAIPITVFTFGLAGLSLMGVPPSGGFVAKVLLLRATVMEGQWWWAAVMLVGGLLAGGYVFMVLGKAFGSADVSLQFAHQCRAAVKSCRSRSRSVRFCSASCRCNRPICCRSAALRRSRSRRHEFQPLSLSGRTGSRYCGRPGP